MKSLESKFYLATLIFAAVGTVGFLFLRGYSFVQLVVPTSILFTSIFLILKIENDIRRVVVFIVGVASIPLSVYFTKHLATDTVSIFMVGTAALTTALDLKTNMLADQNSFQSSHPTLPVERGGE